jgi:hypothetical protein
MFYNNIIRQICEKRNSGLLAYYFTLASNTERVLLMVSNKTKMIRKITFLDSYKANKQRCK